MKDKVLEKIDYQTESKQFIKDNWDKFEAENINDSIYHNAIEENSERVVVAYKRKYKKDFFKFVRLLLQSIIKKGEVVGNVANIYDSRTFKKTLLEKLSRLPINVKLEDGEKYIIDYNIEKTDKGLNYCWNSIIPAKYAVIGLREEYENACREWLQKENKG